MAERSDATGAGDDLARRLDGVEGWLHVDEAEMLYSLVESIAPREAPLVLVEIGSWKGRSSITLGAALLDNGREGRVWAIDPHTGNLEHQREFGEVDTFGEFTENIERAGVAETVTPLRMMSHDARPQFEDGSVDLLFIDGSHEYEDVAQDIDDWLPALRGTSVIAFNDTSWPGVYRALRERVLNHPEWFRDPRLVRSTLFLRYAPATPRDPGERRRWRIMRASLAMRRGAHRIVPILPASVKRLANSLTGRATGSV